MRRLFLAMCLLAATACLEKNPVAPTPVDERVVLGPGQQALVDGQRLTFEAVTGDSRCPGDALCIQGGDAVVKVAVTRRSGSRADYELHTGDMKPVVHDGLTIALVQLAPYPFSSRPPIDPNDYRVTLHITR